MEASDCFWKVSIRCASQMFIKKKKVAVQEENWEQRECKIDVFFVHSLPSVWKSFMHLVVFYT